jgi:hypothetical protein
MEGTNSTFIASAPNSAPLEYGVSIAPGGAEGQMRRPSKHITFSLGCCSFDWAPSHTNICQTFLKLLFCAICSAGLLVGPIYLIIKAQPSINACFELDQDAMFECVRDEEAPVYALLWAIFITLLVIDIHFIYLVWFPRDAPKWGITCVDCVITPNRPVVIALFRALFLLIFAVTIWGTVYAASLGCIESGYAVICVPTTFASIAALVVYGCMERVVK